jgi:hypothetical protein
MPYKVGEEVVRKITDARGKHYIKKEKDYEEKNGI